MSTEVSVYDQDNFLSAIADVRDDASATVWALFGHHDNDPNTIMLIGSGTEGAEEMCDYMDSACYMYALVRVQETFDMSTTIKFAYIQWKGTDVPFTKRGKFGVVSGSIEAHFNPYHASIEIDSTDDLTNEYILSKIAETSGTKSKVLEAAAAKQRPERGFTSGTTTKTDPTGAAPTQSANLGKIGKAGSSFGGFSPQAKGSVGVQVSSQVQEAIAEVRDDSNETNWLACSYESGNVKKPIVLLGTGSDLGDDFRDLCEDGNVVYGLCRVTDIVDDISTTKFAYIQWVGESTKPMTKAKVPTHRGDLEKIFAPVHVTIFATTSNEISQRSIMDKVMSASGSKSHVK